MDSNQMNEGAKTIIKAFYDHLEGSGITIELSEEEYEKLESLGSLIEKGRDIREEDYNWLDDLWFRELA